MSDVDEKVARISALLEERLQDFVGQPNDATMRAHLELIVRELIAEQDLKPVGKFEIEVTSEGDTANITPLNMYTAILLLSAQVGHLVYPTAQQLREAEERGKFSWKGFTLTRTDDGWRMALPPAADHLDVGDMSL